MKKTFLLILMAGFSLSLWALENHDWITEYTWYLEDGRDFVDPSEDHIFWNENQTPQVRFYKIELPRNAVLYQVRLRKELFHFLYHTEDKYKLIPLGSAFGTEIFEVEFGENYSSIVLYREYLYEGHYVRVPYGIQPRINRQENSEYPLVGIWGNLPFQSEYRLINSDECLYYMEIDRRIPGWAVREGTYLLRQTGDMVFETVSSFPDGHLRLELLTDRIRKRILILPLFNVPAEEGRVAPLIMID